MPRDGPPFCSTRGVCVIKMLVAFIVPLNLQVSSGKKSSGACQFHTANNKSPAGLPSGAVVYGPVVFISTPALKPPVKVGAGPLTTEGVLTPHGTKLPAAKDKKRRRGNNSLLARRG